MWAIIEMRQAGTGLLQVIRRRHSRHLLEKAAEMVGILEAKEIGHFANGESLHQERFSLVYNKGVDIADCRPTGRLVNQVAEVSGRIGEF